ncbi:uncharacterized protein LOC130786911 [Actinidia eriantha]|uniref:uncharacterized protein LOC130786911 n=1 Tax=Actinidia eriantha TaxID=165200 RepID=UPI00258B642F|nr:uncharacterized protein LOC130786911 [Actinidia eriantha]
MWINNLIIINFSFHGFEDLFSLSRVPSNLDFLREAMIFGIRWFSLLCFGHEKLCPTFEEFGAALEYPDQDLVVILTSIVDIEHRQYTFFMCLIASFLITRANGRVECIKSLLSSVPRENEDIHKLKRQFKESIGKRVERRGKRDAEISKYTDT